MDGLMNKKELEFAHGYFAVFPCDFKNPNADSHEPFLFIKKDCPPDVKERLLEEWPKVKKATKERHANGEYSSLDYF